MKLGKNIVVNLEKKSGSVRMQMAFGESYSIPALTDAQLAQMTSLAAKRKESLQEGGQVDPTLTFDQVNPQDSDFIYPLFRALSATLIPGYFLDFTKEKVVQDATPLMRGQTIYTNHRYRDVEKWIGAVSQSAWDAKGEKTGGVPGINTELKIDWKTNPRIARGLLMKPPAIHSVSATIDFEFDASHPELLEQGIFFRNLGQEIEGSIVRIVVTKILSFYELSLVFMGANPESNGHLPGDDEEVENELSARELSKTKTPLQLAKSKETHTVKLTAAQKTALGITHESEDVPDADVISVAASLAQRATAADAIVASQRAEVLRLATLVEGAGEGDARKLDPAIATMLDKADASQLPGLTAVYQKKFDEAFPLMCEHGHKLTRRQSSVDEPETAGQEKVSSVEDSDLL